MELTYYPDTDTLTIRFSTRISEETDEVLPGFYLDYDSEGKIVGIDIDNAGKVVDLAEILAAGFPQTCQIELRSESAIG